MACYVDRSDISHNNSVQEMIKCTRKRFSSPSKDTGEKKKRNKKKSNHKAFCVTCKHNKPLIYYQEHEVKLGVTKGGYSLHSFVEYR